MPGNGRSNVKGWLQNMPAKCACYCWFTTSNMGSIFSLNFPLLWWAFKQNSAHLYHVSPFKAKFFIISLLCFCFCVCVFLFCFFYLFLFKNNKSKRKCWRAARLWGMYPLSRVASEYRACTRVFPPCYPTSELESSCTLCSHSPLFFLTFSRLESSQTKKNMATKLQESFLDIEKKLDEINGNITDRCNVM